MTLRIRIQPDAVETAFFAPDSPSADVQIEVDALSPDGLRTRTRRRRNGHWEVVSQDRYALPVQSPAEDEREFA